MKILKLIKHEYKSVIILPIALMLFLTVCMLIDIIRISNMGNDNIVLKSNFTNVIVFLTILVTALMLAKKNWQNYNMYKFADISEHKIILSRMLLIFAITFFVTLICMIENTLVNSILLDKLAEIVEKESSNEIFMLRFNYNAYACSYGMNDMPFVSWLLPISTGLFSVLTYAIGIALTSIARFKKCKLLCALAFFVGVIALFCIEFVIEPLITNSLNNLNFNKAIFIKNKITFMGKSLIPYNELNFFNNNNSYANYNYNTINIFSVGGLLFTIFYIILLSYISLIKQKDIINTKINCKKKNLITVSILSVFVMGFSLFALIVSRPPKEFANNGCVNEIHLIRAHYGEKIDLNQFMDINKYQKFKNCNTIIYTQDNGGSSSGKRLTALYGEIAEGSKIDNNYIVYDKQLYNHTAVIFVQNKYTNYIYEIHFLDIILDEPEEEE